VKKAITAVATVTALAMAITAPAANAAKLSGEITDDPKASLSLVVKEVDDVLAVSKFKARKLPIRCDGVGDARLRSAALDGAARVGGKGRFKLVGRNDTQRLRIEGKLVGKDGAKGTLKYSGLTEFENGSRECRTGKLRWVASR
jgi:hypothetical protein